MKTKRTSSVALRTLHHFFQEIRHEKWLSCGMFILTPAVIFIRSALAPLILADIIAKVTAGTIPEDQLFATLAPEAFIFLGIYILSSIVFEKLRLYFCWKMEVRAMYRLASKCFNALATQTMRFHSDRFGGSLVSQTNKFIGAFERLIDGFIWNALPLICSMIFIFVILWPLAPLYTTALAIFVALYTLISGLTFKKLAHLNEKEASAQTKQTGQLADSISNILSVKSYGRESHERHRYANFQRASMNASLDLLRAFLTRDILFSFVGIGITAASLFFLIGGPAWFGISISTMVLIVTYSQQVMVNLWDINHIFKDVNRVFGDASEMTIILDEANEVTDTAGAPDLKVTKGAVSFKNISFRHADAREPLFENFDLEIKPGEQIGLVGVSGSGKTTLTKLLLRFSDVTSGAILIDSQDIASVTQNSLRENIAYVPQETALFHRTISENIAYARPEATEAEIRQAARLANAEEFILDLPQGYDTLVGERGIKLSGGQRQRISIARAILKNAPILALDEATSALDSESESLIQAALTTLMKNRTSLVIAHRLSTVASLDRIIVLKNGQIAEQGTHQQLLKKSGEYAKLWSRQTGAFLDTEN